MTYQLLLLSILTMVSLCILIIKQKKINRDEYNAIKDLVASHEYNNDGDIVILGLDYQTAIFNEINTMLSNMNYSIFIVLFSPEWLVLPKKKLWKNHTIIHMNQLTTDSFMWNRLIILKSTGRIINIREIVEFIKMNKL